MSNDLLDLKSFDAYKKLDRWARWPRCKHLSRDYYWKNSVGVVYYECYKCRESCHGFQRYCDHYEKPDLQLELNFDL